MTPSSELHFIQVLHYNLKTQKHFQQQIRSQTFVWCLTHTLNWQTISAMNSPEATSKQFVRFPTLVLCSRFKHTALQGTSFRFKSAWKPRPNCCPKPTPKTGSKRETANGNGEGKLEHKRVRIKQGVTTARKE